jgi:hypothetical protein
MILLKLNNYKMRQEILINEIEQLILHAEEDSLTYSVLEHARKLVFEVSKESKTDKPTRMFCQICGHVHKIDFWVPNEIWDACIHPRFKDTHICINCFMERADESLLEWDKEIKFFPCSLATQIKIQSDAS